MLNVRNYGAMGDGQALDSPAIQAAIEAAAAQGGGEVRIPAGRYRCGMIALRSGVMLHLEAGAVLAALMDDPSLYPVICETPHQNKPGQIRALIYADGAESTGIIGQGVIDGGCYAPLNFAESDAARWRLNATFIRDCRRVRVQGVTFHGIDFWTLHLQRCQDVLISGVQIDNHLERFNNDGIDPDGCCDVIISDCNIRTFDDCIVLKSTEKDVCERIAIHNCILRSSGGSALKLGTEALGDIRSVTVGNCAIYGSDIGVALYMKDGSTYENLVFSNLIIETASNFPIFFDITARYYREPTIGRIRNVTLANIIVRGSGRAFITGDAAQPIEGVTLQNITWQVTGAFDPKARKPGGTRRKELDPNVTIDTSTAALFLLRQVDGVRMNGVQMRFDGVPDRALVACDHVRNLVTASDTAVQEVD
jgi:polygalacturonase